MSATGSDVRTYIVVGANDVTHLIKVNGKISGESLSGSPSASSDAGAGPFPVLSEIQGQRLEVVKPDRIRFRPGVVALARGRARQ
jgi:hypothetical protein